MARVVPSQAVSTISKLFPDAATGGPGIFPLNTMAAIKSVLSIITRYQKSYWSYPRITMQVLSSR